MNTTKHQSAHYYTCIGDIRGECGHRHQSEVTAQRCLDSDADGCASRGGYTDRVIIEFLGGEEIEPRGACCVHHQHGGDPLDPCDVEEPATWDLVEAMWRASISRAPRLRASRYADPGGLEKAALAWLADHEAELAPHSRKEREQAAAQFAAEQWGGEA